MLCYSITILLFFYRQGRVLGRDEGRLLGLDKGFEIGYEMGVYLGCITMLQTVPPGEWKHATLPRHIDALYHHMTRHDVCMDPRKEELQDYVNDVRSKFKVIMALLDSSSGLGDEMRHRIAQGTGMVMMSPSSSSCYKGGAETTQTW